MINRYVKTICSAMVSGLMCGVVGLIPSGAYAVPAYRGAITHVQPDGAEIQIFRSGDERYSEIRDAEGCLLHLSEDGWALPVTQEQIVAKRAASEQPPKYLFSGTPFPCEGSPKGLVVLAEFADRGFSMDDPNDFYTRMLNEEGFSDYGATGSARDFFMSNSNGVFTPQFDVYGPIQLNNIMKYYGANNLYDEDMRPYEVVIECLQKLDPTVDFSQYDLDGDGQIDNVFVFYAGYGEADSNIPTTIWPHSADLTDFGIDENYYFDGKLLNRYGISNEIDYTYRRPDGIGTFVHEFSHVMGLPDLYSTVYNSAFTPGTYSTLDYGPYNNEGRTPPHYSIFERYSLGWCSPIALESSSTYLLEPIHLSNAGYIIHTDKENEFFLLENRQLEDYDKFIPGHGMLVWHVDFNQQKWDDNVVNNTVRHQYVDIVEADGRLTEGSRAGDTFPGTAGVTEFAPFTSPSLTAWSGSSVGVAISEIQEIGTKIKFKALVDKNAVETVQEADTFSVYSREGEVVNCGTSVVVVYDLSGREAGRVAPGASIRLEEGLYVVVAGSQSRKLLV